MLSGLIVTRVRAKATEGPFPEADSESEEEYSSAEDKLRPGLLKYAILQVTRLNKQI